MIKSCDVGSLPFINDSAKLLEGAMCFSLSQADESAEYFEKTIVSSFLDKLRSDLDVPNYPQFRDMNKMFLSMIHGLEKIEAGYLETKIPSLKRDSNQIAEVMAIERNSRMIQELTGEPFELKLCVTGPYTLASFFPYRNEGTFNRLGNVISQILECNIFRNKHGKTSLVSVDEPLFGLLDDPNIDFGSKGRESLLSAWETIFHKVKTKNIQTMMHLHSTSNPLFWEIPSLNVIDSHVGDPFIQMKKTGELLESRDKFLKASIAINDFDTLIKKRIVEDSQKKPTDSDLNAKIADVWTEINHGKVDSTIFLETVDIMKGRLLEVVERFGEERVMYAGPECGLKGYPTYDTALECLKRVSRSIKKYNK